MINASILCWTVTFFANLAYWNGRKTEQLNYFAAAGWLRSILLVCAWACIAANVAWLLRLVSLEIACVSTFVFMTGYQTYSIWFRWHLRRKSKMIIEGVNISKQRAAASPRSICAPPAPHCSLRSLAPVAWLARAERGQRFILYGMGWLPRSRSSITRMTPRERFRVGRNK
jgi:type VI protein secretion system component VasK